jgi:hypothetical protein
MIVGGKIVKRAEDIPSVEEVTVNLVGLQRAVKEWREQLARWLMLKWASPLI